MSSILRRGEIPLAIVAVTMFAMFGDKYLAVTAISTFAAELKAYAIVITAFAAYVSLLALARYNLRQISRRTPNVWIPSAAGLVMLVLTLVVGLGFGSTSDLYQTIYYAAISPGGWAFNGAIIFYIS